MNLRPRLATFSLPLLLIGCFLCWPLCATGDRIAAGPLAEPLTANNSAGLQQAAPPDQAASPQSPAKQADPPFFFEPDGKGGDIDKNGQIGIPLQYYPS